MSTYLQDMIKYEAQKIEQCAADYRVFDHDSEDDHDDNEYYDTNEQYIEEETLDCEFSIDSNGRYLGARFILTIGGPTIVADSRSGTVYGSWGTNSFEWGLSEKARDWLHERGSEMFENLDL